MKDIIKVAKGKCPLDVLSEMGNRTKSAWIYFHKSIIVSLSEDVSIDNASFTDKQIYLHWKATEDSPETCIVLRKKTCCWYEVQIISADDIAFEFPADNPEEVLFFEMEEE